MQAWQTALILDLLAIIVTALLIWKSSKSGFLTSFLDYIGYLSSLIIGRYFSDAVSEFVYDKYFHEKIVATLDSAMLKMSSGLDWTDALKLATQELPGTAREIVSSVFGSLTQETQQFLYNSAMSVASDFVNTTIKPLVISLLTSIFFLLMFTLSFALIKYASKALVEKSDKALKGKLNTILGGTLGFLKAVLILLIAFTALDLFAALTDNNSSIINAGVLDSSFSHKLIQLLNPFL